MGNLRELEALKSQYAEAETLLSSSIKEQGVMSEALATYRKSGDLLEESLRASVGTDDHMRILHEMSQDYLASIHRWEERQKTTEQEHKAMFEAEVQALQGALSQRRAQLDGLGPAEEETEELQRARRECQELEAESARLADQLQQLARVQPWVVQRQSQVESAQLRVLETWRGLQSEAGLRLDTTGETEVGAAGGPAPPPPAPGCATTCEPWLPQPAMQSSAPTQAASWQMQATWPQAALSQPVPPSPQAQRPMAMLTRGPLPSVRDTSPRHHHHHHHHGGAPVPPGMVLRSVRR